MKTHQVPERPADLGENPQPLELANFILWKLLHMPVGGLYAKWNDSERQAVWYFSNEQDYAFREPQRGPVIFEERDRARFRSSIFRLGSLCDDGLNGSFAFGWPDSKLRRFFVHSAFYPETGIGLWIAITTTEPPVK
jgi:hypothetical protein